MTDTSGSGDIEEIEQAEELVARVAAIDIAKASGMVCVRVPHEDQPGKRVQRVFNTVATSGAILDLADHLICQGVTRVVMEATSTYWKPYFFLLESRGLECWLVNARDVKNVPGRPKTDRLDAVWLAKLTERGMLRASFVPPKPVRELRDLTRARAVMTHERTRHKQRTEKLLEDAQIKLSTTEDDEGPGQTTLIPVTDTERLDEIPGIGPSTAQVILAEIGLDMSVFPTAGHLVSWAKLSPRTLQSGNKNTSGPTGKGNPWLRGALGEAAISAARTDTFLGARYRRIVKRRGHMKALVAVARSILVSVWHLMNDPTARYRDLGADFHTRNLDPGRKSRDLVRQLKALGHDVTLTPATA